MLVLSPLLASPVNVYVYPSILLTIRSSVMIACRRTRASTTQTRSIPPSPTGPCPPTTPSIPPAPTTTSPRTPRPSSTTHFLSGRCPRRASAAYGTPAAENSSQCSRFRRWRRPEPATPTLWLPARSTGACPSWGRCSTRGWRPRPGHPTTPRTTSGGRPSSTTLAGSSWTTARSWWTTGGWTPGGWTAGWTTTTMASSRWIRNQIRSPMSRRRTPLSTYLVYAS